MKICLIRHGKTKGNLQRRYIGKTDEFLDIQGVIELERLAAEGIYPMNCDKIYSSPMHRCLQTARIIYPNHTPEIIDGLHEMSFGKFEGLTYDEIIKIKGFSNFGIDTESYVFPEGESIDGFKDRCIRAFSSLDSKNAAVIIHGGVIMMIMEYLFGGNMYDFHVENGRGFIIRGEKTLEFQKI